MKPKPSHSAILIPPPAHTQRWLTTFNDLITLLMVFFILLFSMGTVDVQRFKHFQNALQSAMGVLNAGRHAPVGIITENESEYYLDNTPTQDDGKQTDQLKGLPLTPGLEAEYTRQGIQLILDDKLLFSSGRDDLTPTGFELLNRVSKIIQPLGRYIRVEGHTDNVPISNHRFSSNWELSTARAIRVVKYLAESGGIDPAHLSVAGYGSIKPRVPNDNAFNLTKNRRVEIILGQAVMSPEDGYGDR